MILKVPDYCTSSKRCMTVDRLQFSPMVMAPKSLREIGHRKTIATSYLIQACFRCSKAAHHLVRKGKGKRESLVVYGRVQAICLIHQDWLVKLRGNALSDVRYDGSRYKALSNN